MRLATTSTLRPLARYWLVISASLPQHATLYHVTRSPGVPSLLVQRAFTATEKLVTVLPEGVKRISGSRPRLPTMVVCSYISNPP